MKTNKKILKKIFGFYSEELDDKVLYLLEEYSYNYIFNQLIVSKITKTPLVVFHNGEYLNDNISKIKKDDSIIYVYMSLVSSKETTHESKYDSKFYKELDKITKWLESHEYIVDRSYETTTGYKLILFKNKNLQFL